MQWKFPYGTQNTHTHFNNCVCDAKRFSVQCAYILTRYISVSQYIKCISVRSCGTWRHIVLDYDANKLAKIRNIVRNIELSIITCFACKICLVHVNFSIYIVRYRYSWYCFYIWCTCCCFRQIANVGKCTEQKEATATHSTKSAISFFRAASIWFWFSGRAVQKYAIPVS